MKRQNRQFTKFITSLKFPGLQYSKVSHGPMFASGFESTGGDRKLLRASSFTALNLLFSRCTTRNFPDVDQTVWAQHTGSIFSNFESSPCHRAERYGCHRFGVAELLPKKLICSKGRQTKDFRWILNSIPETLPRMLKKHAAKDGTSLATRRAKSERLSGILSL